MMDEKQRLRSVYKVTIAGSIINVLLLVLKFAAGILGHSAAMIADAIHSLTDFATDVVVLVFVKLGNKPKDKDHDYGHGKYETLATAIIVSAFIIKAAWGLVMQSVKELTDASLPEMEEDEILKIANEEQGVGEIHNLRTRRIGNKIAIEMHVRMPGSLSLYEAHEHATHIETKLKQHFGADTHVGIHLEPIKVNGKYQKPE